MSEAILMYMSRLTAHQHLSNWCAAKLGVYSHHSTKCTFDVIKVCWPCWLQPRQRTEQIAEQVVAPSTIVSV